MRATCGSAVGEYDHFFLTVPSQVLAANHVEGDVPLETLAGLIEEEFRLITIFKKSFFDRIPGLALLTNWRVCVPTRGDFTGSRRRA